MKLTCIKCNEEMFNQSTIENKKDIVKVFFCKKCEYEVLVEHLKSMKGGKNEEK